MANISAALRKALQARSAEESGQIAEAWAVEDVLEAGWTEMSEYLAEHLQDLIAARFAWESLSQDAREILHQMITFEVMDGVPREDLQKLTRTTAASFAAALAQLEQRLMLIEVRPDAKVRLRMEMRGQQASTVLAIPKDFRELFTTIDHEIYGPRGDRTRMQLIELLETYDVSKLQAMVRLHDIRGYGLPYYMNDKIGLAKSLAGKLVQPDAIEAAWEKLAPDAQKMCRWLCRADGSAEAGELRTALGLSKPALSHHLHQLEDYGLAFDTFSGQEHRIFIGRGTFKVMRTFIGEMDQLAEKTKEHQEFVVLQEAPPIIHEARGQLLYDLAIAVGATYQMVIEPTKEGRVPRRLANKIFPLMHGSRPAPYEDIDNYLDIIFAIAEELDLIQLQERTGQKARYMPGPKLAEWTNLRTSEQIRRLLDIWRSPTNNFWSDVAGAHYRPHSYGYGYDFGFYMDMRAARKGLLDYLTQQCRPGQWYVLESFLQTTKARNPMLLREQSRYAAYGGMRNRKDVLANWDQSDGEIIAGILASTLYELGLVSLGFQSAPAMNGDAEPGNPYAFCLTDLTAEVFWPEQAAAKTEPSSEQSRNLIVQPNFELLLLHPDYSTLYQLLPFARVDQVEMVSRLTLTQESVRRGVEAGWSIERMLQTLRERSQKDLPQNVLYTLQDWSRLYKDATVSQVILLEVSSEAVADEICASSKFRALELRRLGPCAIAVGGQISLQVLRSTLEKEGVILHIQGDILSARDVASPSSTYYGRRR
jgi:DNA-binding transcriptional ArsR family regulator